MPVRFLFCFLLAAASTCPQDGRQPRASTADKLVQAFAALGVHKVYVPDGCDAYSRPTPRGAYFAANFSDLLGRKAKSFNVLSRADAHQFLLQHNSTDCDLAKPDTLAPFSSAFTIDSVLWLGVSPGKNSYSIDFLLCDLAGKDLFRSHYDERFQTFTEAYFPPTASRLGWPFYFSMLDGVTAPKGQYMPNPPYPEKKRMDRISGIVIISAIVAVTGKIDEMFIAQKLDPDIDKSALETVRHWRFEPAKTPDGSAVPVRVAFECNFRLY